MLSSFFIYFSKIYHLYNVFNIEIFSNNIINIFVVFSILFSQNSNAYISCIKIIVHIPGLNIVNLFFAYPQKVIDL